MTKELQLSDLTDVVSALGYADLVLDAIRDAFYTDHPNKRAVIESNAVSTIPHDATVPMEWALTALQSLGVPPSDAKGMLQSATQPGAIPYGHPDRQELLDMVLELLPSPASIKKGIRMRNAEGARTAGRVPAISDEQYQEKVRDITQKILKTPYVGFRAPRGNTKIGTISQFSLPAGQHFRGAACPGATEFCESLCYAKATLFTFHEAQYYINWAYVQLWPERFLDVWRELPLTEVVRIHVGGDFFSPAYVDLWAQIVSARPDVRFYAYTRSWQNGSGKIAKDFIEPLRRLAQLPNMRLLLSMDHITGVPDQSLVPGAMRAWLAADDNDMPSEPVELIFRDKAGMSPGSKNVMADTAVCLVERNPSFIKKVGSVTCRNCSWCWSSGHDAYGLRQDDVSQFDAFAKTDLTKKVHSTFVVHLEKGGANLGDAPTESCPCRADVPCAHCGRCAYCSCVCA